MKKCNNFLMVLATIVLCLGVSFASAQEPLFSEDFSGVTGSGTQQCEANGSTITNTLDNFLQQPGWSGDYVYPANGKVKLGTGSANGWIETPAIDLNGVGSIRIVFDARAWNTNNASDGTTMTVTVNGTSYLVEGLANSGSTQDVQCDLTTFEVIAAGGGSTTIRFEGSPRAFLDNVAVYAATDPTISVQGTTSFTNVPVNQQCSSNLTVKGFNLTAGGTTEVALSGDSQFTISASSYSNDDLMSEDGVSLPFIFSAAEAGSYTATLSLTNSDAAATVTLSATVIEITEVPTIADLRALINNSDVNQNYTDSVFYKYTGHGFVTQVFKSGSSTKWIQDESGAIQLYDPDGYLSNVAQGMEITNVVGKMVNYYGYVEMNVQSALATTDINAFPTNIPEALAITLEQLQDQTYMDAIQGQLVKLENVTFSATGTFTKQTRYVLSQGGVTDTAVYFTGAYDTQVGADIPTTACNIIGVNMRTAAYSAGYGTPRVDSRYYILPREFAPVTGISENGTTRVSVYPNPASDNVTLTIGGDATTVSVYNVMGTLVSTQPVSCGANTVNMSSLPAGVYFLRITNGNEAVGTVKVVRQ